MKVDRGIKLRSADNIILVGFMGTGKTLAGQEIARLLGWEFVDTDAEIEERVGKPVSRIFEEDGEEAFRLLERQTLREVCLGHGRVVSTGGGAMVDPENRELMLNRGYVVCLDASPETIHSRLVSDDTNPVAVRPLLAAPDPLERIKVLKGQRKVYYSAAHQTVHTDSLTVGQTAQEVVNAFFTIDSPQRHRDTEMTELNEITKQIIGCAIEVHRHLGPGLLEHLYEEALCFEFQLQGLNYRRQVAVPFTYKDKPIGEHRIDLLVEDEIVVEIKSVERDNPIFEAHVLTYLKVTGKKVGLLMNFNSRLMKSGIKRFIL